MRVLIYSYSFAPDIGGVETYVNLLATGLARRAGGSTSSGDVVHVAVVTRTACSPAAEPAMPFRVVRRPGLRRLWSLIGESDVVHLAGPALLPLVIALLRRKPVVIEHHGYQAVCPNGLLFRMPHRESCPGHFMKGRLGKCLACVTAAAGWRRAVAQVCLTFPRRLLCRLASANVAISDHVSRRIGLPRAQTIYHGVDGPTREKSGRPAHPLTFAYVGRLVGEKGLPLLLEAAAGLWKERQDFNVAFIGDGPERWRLEGMAKTLGLGGAVKFAGFLSGPALQDAVDGVAAVVMPSIWEETAGLAAIEHMMRGRVVIAADIGGLGEVVGDAGLKFQPGDRESLTARMRQVIEQPELAATLGARARARARQLFRAERMVEDHLDLFLKLRRGTIGA